MEIFEGDMIRPKTLGPASHREIDDRDVTLFVVSLRDRPRWELGAYATTVQEPW